MDITFIYWEECRSHEEALRTRRIPCGLNNGRLDDEAQMNLRA
jgi:hypothetical protein